MAKTTASPPVKETAIDQSMHALPRWFAAFQRTFGLSFLVACSAYLMGKLATLGWVPDIFNPSTWGWFNGAGVVLFFLGGVVISGIALTCSLTFARTIQTRPFGMGQFILALFTLLGMFLFFGIEVWASLAERSTYLVATPVDKTVIAALGFHGTPPISPTAVIVSLMFPLGSLYFGFVQQSRNRTTEADIADDALSMEQQIQHEELAARLERAKAKKNAARAKGFGRVVKAGLSGVQQEDDDEDDAFVATASSNGHSEGSPPDFP